MLRERIQFYNWNDFARIYQELGQQEIIRSEELSEIFWCAPLWINQIQNTRKDWVAGKIIEQNNAFDIILAEAEEARSGTLQNPIIIQVKQLFTYPNDKVFTLKEWTLAAQQEINKQKTKTNTPQGIFYLASRLIIDTFNRVDFYERLSLLKIPFGFQYAKVIVCLNLKVSSGYEHKSFVIYEIYPSISIINNIPISNNKYY